MEKEKALNQQEQQVGEEPKTEAEQVEEVDEQVEVLERSSYVVCPGIHLEREVTLKNGVKYSSFYVTGTLRKTKVLVRVRPAKLEDGFTDLNAFNLLDIVFGGEDTAPFAVRVERTRDYRTGRTSRRVSYYAYVVDELEGEYAAPLRFESAPDKAMVQKLVELDNRKYELGITL